jgi:hypothetical protein
MYIVSAVTTLIVFIILLIPHRDKSDKQEPK